MKKSPLPVSPETPGPLVGDNRYWHSYGLQRLNPERFRNAVNDILGRRSILITPMRQEIISENFSESRLLENF